MSFEIVEKYEVNVYFDELVDYDEDEFVLNFNIAPYILYNGKCYDYVGIKKSIFWYHNMDEINDWRKNYLEKLDQLELACYDDNNDCIDYSGITIKDIGDDYLRENLFREVKKRLIEGQI